MAVPNNDICHLFTIKVEIQIQYNTNEKTGQTDYKLHIDLICSWSYEYRKLKLLFGQVQVEYA